MRVAHVFTPRAPRARRPSRVSRRWLANSWKGLNAMSHDQGSADPFLGRMNDPTGSAYVRGLCGDEMEFYLYIRDNVIEEVKYYTEGCENTKPCARAVAERAQGRTLLDALSINPKEIIDSDPSLVEAERHCAILAVTTLYRAIADYMLLP